MKLIKSMTSCLDFCHSGKCRSNVLIVEIAEKEGITVTPEELEVRLQLMRGQYQDPQMQSELAKPENISGIRNQMLTEKTFKFLTEIASKKN